MNTKEAIEFVDELRFGNPYKMDTYINKIFEVIDLLKRGEKYERMWGDLEEELETLPFSVAGSTPLRMREVKRKYFPELKSRWQRIKGMIKVLNNLGISSDNIQFYYTLNPSHQKELVNLLIELRDEEE